MQAGIRPAESDHSSVDAGGPVNHAAPLDIKPHRAVPDPFQEASFQPRIVQGREHRRVDMDHGNVVANFLQLVSQPGADGLARPIGHLHYHLLRHNPFGANGHVAIRQRHNHQVACVGRRIGPHVLPVDHSACAINHQPRKRHAQILFHRLVAGWRRLVAATAPSHLPTVAGA